MRSCFVDRGDGGAGLETPAASIIRERLNDLDDIRTSYERDKAHEAAQQQHAGGGAAIGTGPR